ncbi:MAG: rhodanese-like domain-containing protein [Campylobacterota bacterium]|nr:rhodanese-like domain-containing protein [Campylobacterota bacterium]
MKKFQYVVLLVLLSISVIYGKNLRIEPKELAKELNNYTILDTRTFKEYKKGHIKGALNFPINLTYEHKKIDGKLANPIKMQKIIRDLGLTNKTAIVIYDDGTFFDSARLFWSLEVYGFTDVKLLNSGYKEWLNNGYKISKTTPIIKRSNYISEVNHKRLATKFTTQIATHNPNQVIVDARDYKSYIGEKSSAKRFGHIPKAIHIPATHNINYKKNQDRLKKEIQLKEVYNKIDKNKKVVIYCSVGRAASTNYFALRELGYDVSNYDASWNEWGNDFNLPIRNRLKKK